MQWGGGPDELRMTMEKVSDTLQIGSHEQEMFICKGLRTNTVRNVPNNPFETVLDGDDYLASAEAMKSPSGPAE